MRGTGFFLGVGLPKMDQAKVDQILGFALATASEEDFGNRELGPIHLVKYVYLADMAYAEKHNGETYTGADWTFHHFGPWSPGVFARIAKVVDEMGARTRTIPSTKLEDNTVRYSLSQVEEPTMREMVRGLPLEVYATVKRDIHKFGSDTNELLHHVYNTPPMVTTAPGEPIRFLGKPEAPNPEPSAPPLSKGQEKKRDEALKKLQEKLKARLDAPRKTKLIRPEVVYDEKFEEVTAWLDSLAGEPTKPQEGELTFDSTIWKSPARSGHR